MNVLPEKLKWEIRKRLEEIERQLYWKGSLGRADLTQQFGISLQQASADISRYFEIAPNNATFNPSSKRYDAAAEMDLQLIDHTIDDYVKWDMPNKAIVDKVTMPQRLEDKTVIIVQRPQPVLDIGR